MPHISPRKLKNEVLNKLYNQFGNAFEKSARQSQTKFFLGDLLTKTEKIMLAKRFAVIYLLEKDIPISYIAESLKMSYTTVSKMSFKYEIGKYSLLLRAVERNKNNIWSILEKILRAGLPPRAGRGRWKFLYK